MKTIVTVAWYNPEQKDKFCEHWMLAPDDSRVHFQQDRDKSGCAATKNQGITEALNAGADVIVVLDDDCLPEGPLKNTNPLGELIKDHLAALEPQPVEMFQVVTDPPSRGTPYFNRTITMPVAASIGFWTGVGDYDAPGQLVHGARNPMLFHRQPIFGRYFPLSGMNFAFRKEWSDCVQFVDVPRFDDIWMGFIFQKVAYAHDHCFNLGGPDVRHSRQSNVWQNLRDEAEYLEQNETIWQKIAEARAVDPSQLRRLICR